MTEYLLINVLISLWALVSVILFNVHLKTNFHVLIFALTSWAIPFGVIELSEDMAFFEQTSPAISTAKAPVAEVLNHATGFNLTMKSLLFILMTIGLFWYVYDLNQLYKKHRKFLKQAKLTNEPDIYTIKDLNNACITGFYQPKIWIDEHLYYSELGPTIIRHEKQHIQSLDHIWLLYIHLFHRVFWFNPFTRLLSSKIKLAIEMKCDYICKQQTPGNFYQLQLAQILLKMSHQNSTTTNHMSQTNKNNMYRIKKLNEDNPMKPIHKFFFIISLVLTAFISINVLANTGKQTAPQLNSNQILLEVAYAEVDESNNDPLEKKHFSVIANDKETATVKINNTQFQFKPTILKGRDEDTQILCEVIIEDLNTAEILARPSLMIINNKNASIVLDDEKEGKKLVLEIKPTVGT